MLQKEMAGEVAGDIALLLDASDASFSSNQNSYKATVTGEGGTASYAYDWQDGGGSGAAKMDVKKKKRAIPRKMIWTARLTFQVENVDSSTKTIQEIIKKHGGFVSRMDMESDSYQITNSIQIRIANDKFEELLAAFKKEASKVDELRVHSADVTEEFIDILSRLKTKKEVRARYIDVLRNKTGKVKDIIAAEEAIRKITEEIEAKEGRLRYLKDKVNFSTITLTLYETVDYSEAPVKIYEKPYVKKLVEGLSNGWTFITTFVLVLANLWPLLLFIALLIWKRKWIAGKFRKIK